jgi:hypothetical protein
MCGALYLALSENCSLHCVCLECVRPKRWGKCLDPREMKEVTEEWRQMHNEELYNCTLHKN